MHEPLYPIYRESFLKQYVNECCEDNSNSETILADEDDKTALLHRRRTTRKLQMRGTITDDLHVDHPLDDDFQQPPHLLSPRARCNTVDHQVPQLYIKTTPTIIF